MAESIANPKALEALNDKIAKSTLGDLLWSNSNDTLGATTIQIPNLYTYDEIRIVWNDTGDGSDKITYAVPLIGASVILFAFDISGDNDYNHALNARSRFGRFVSEGIQWNNGQMLYYNGVYKDWQGRAVPIKIYGIKYT